MGNNCCANDNTDTNQEHQIDDNKPKAQKPVNNAELPPAVATTDGSVTPDARTKKGGAENYARELTDIEDDDNPGVKYYGETACGHVKEDGKYQMIRKGQGK